MRLPTYTKVVVKAAACSCPTGDGSLRWPCAAHPTAPALLADGFVMMLAAPVAAANSKPGARCEVNRANDFERGYFCATAVLLRETGSDDSEVRSLFSQGGDPNKADEIDIELFREHGLMPKGGG